MTDALPASTGDYAISLLHRGYDVQNVARMCGMHLDSVRMLAPPRKPRIEYVPTVRPTVVRLIEVQPPAPPRADPMAVVEAVARKYGRTAHDLISARQTRPYAWPRHEAMAALHDQFGLSYPRIGQFFGGRDHTTALAAVRAYKVRRAWCDVVMAMARAA